MDRLVLVTEEMRIAGAQVALLFGDDGGRQMAEEIYRAMAEANKCEHIFLGDCLPNRQEIVARLVKLGQSLA